MDVGRRTLLGLIGAATIAGVAITMPGRDGGAKSVKHRYPFRLSDDEWRRRLSPGQYAVLRQAATERPGSSPLDRERRRGVYHCAGCSHRLFSSAAKFDSGTGWPSFWRPLPGAIVTSIDTSLGIPREEVRCANCGSHLGHVFNDGPRPTGLRYCMNGVALAFRAV